MRSMGTIVLVADKPRKETRGWFIATILALLFAWLATPANAQQERPGETVGASRSLPMPSVGRAVVIQSRPRRAEDRPVVILLDEIREPMHKRQPELTLGVDPTRNARFVRISAQGLVPPPTIQILCSKAMQALRLSASSQESDRTAGTYELSPELAATILAAENCHVSLAGALVAIPYEMTLAVWGLPTVGQPGDAATDQTTSRLATHTGCASQPTAEQIAADRLSPSARLTAIKVVNMLGELSAWANGPASKGKKEYLSRLTQLEEVSEEFSSAAPGSEEQLVGVVNAALGCFREAARSWPDVNALWTIADQNVRAAERSLGIKSPADRREEARQRAQEEQQQTQAQREAKQREANARDARKRLPANASEQADGGLVLARVPFNRSDYFHRWSKNGTNEFTPQGEEDLNAWKSMLTIIVYDTVRTGDDLAGVANRVLGAYQARGRVVKTDSKPRTGDREAEHFVAVVLADPKFLEAVFARFLLFERTGIVVLFAKRVYGGRVGDDMSAWLVKNGPAVEEALMSWKGIPSLTVLSALPQAK